MTDWVRLHGEAFRGVRCCVTGGAGFIGSHLVGALVTLGARVRVLDDFTSGKREQAGGVRGVEVVEGSVTDRGAVRQAVSGSAVVFHEAARVSVPESVAEPGRYHETNTTGTLHVLEASREAGVKRVMFAASSSCYGEPSPEQLPLKESEPTRPLSPYAASKVAGEAYLAAWSAMSELDRVSLRYFNIYGSRQAADSAYAAVIAAFADAALAGRPLRIFGDGGQTRDFTHVDNAVHANLLAARCGSRLDGQSINVATGHSITVRELAERVRAAVSDMTGREVPATVFEPERAGDVRHSAADISRARAVLGYEPVIGLDEGLAETLAWYAGRS